MNEQVRRLFEELEACADQIEELGCEVHLLVSHVFVFEPYQRREELLESVRMVEGVLGELLEVASAAAKVLAKLKEELLRRE